MDKFLGYFKEEPLQTVYYCIDENLISIDKFVEFEHKVLDSASQKKYRLFKTFDTQINFIVICKN